jgi:hypothetical protein
LAHYFEGGKTIENWRLLRQGGVTRREGSRFIREVKNSTKDTILLPFEFSVDDAFVIEAGDMYFRFFKNKAPILTSAGGPAVEVASPYVEADLRTIHFTQSADVLFLFHGTYQQRRLSRVSDTNWQLNATTYTPPPSFEADTDISGGTVTLTPAATTGTGIVFTASGAVFYKGDIGRLIIFGASRAVIVGIGSSAGDPTSPNTIARCDILDAFPNTNPIAAGSWLLRLSPQGATLDPTIREPVGAIVTMVANVDTFRAADVGKFISIYGGLVKITSRTSATTVVGEIMSILIDATSANPPATAAGSWTLEESSWSASRGFPRTGEFLQGRLYQADTAAQPTTLWGSASDDFDSYAVGAFADNAVEYMMASRKINRIEWLTETDEIFIGTSGSEHRALGNQTDAPLGGDIIPNIKKTSGEGCAPMQPIVIGKRILFVDRSLQKVFMIGFDIQQDGFTPVELTVAAEHIAKGTVENSPSKFRLGHIAFQVRPDKRLYWVREDGELVTLTFLPEEKVIGFTRYVTDGLFQSVAVIPQAAGKPDQVWVIVKRTINGVDKRFVEVLDEQHESLSGRAWTSLQTDCAIVYSGAPATTIPGLSHLEGETVDVIADSGYRGTKVVTGGIIELDEEASVVEVGLHYDSDLETMRPAIQGQNIEGLPRSWDKAFVRLKSTLGGTVNDKDLRYVPDTLDTAGLFTGDQDARPEDGWGTEGRIRIQQTQPYPMTVLAAFGTLSLGDTD